MQKRLNNASNAIAVIFSVYRRANCFDTVNRMNVFGTANFTKKIKKMDAL